MEITLCESCIIAGIQTPATTHSINPDWSGYDLCADCAAHYDNEEPVGYIRQPIASK